MYGGVRVLFDEVQCIMSNGHMDHLVKRQTDIIENITFKELTCWRVVIKNRNISTEEANNQR